jgi:hypothetical protein
MTAVHQDIRPISRFKSYRTTRLKNARSGAADQVQPDAPPQARKALLPQGRAQKALFPRPQGRAQPFKEGEATMCMLNGEKQHELGEKGNRSIPVDLAMNFSPTQLLFPSFFS